MPSKTTLTTEISALQVKLLFLQYKSIKINQDIERINSFKYEKPESPESITRKGEIAFNLIDIIALFEGYHSLIQDIFDFETINSNLSAELRKTLNELKKITLKWKLVRNKIGGHLDIDSIREFCNDHNYKGVFISNNLEVDFKGVLIIQMIESAINLTLDTTKLFEEKLTLTDASDLRRVISKINSDWMLCLSLFNTLFTFFYQIGREEKLRSITESDIGIIKF